jgi:hypothetical protein
VYRENRMVIKLNTNEKEAIARLAKVVRLPPSTLARKMLLDEAERRGLLAESGVEEHDS